MAILEIKDLTKKFGGLVAVDQCSFALEPNIILSFIGPNGAGKTTLFNLISGLLAPTDGSIRFDGRSVAGRPTHEIAQGGIGRTFQNIQLFKEATVLDNVRIGGHCRSQAGILGSLFRMKSQRVEEKDILEKARRNLQFVDLYKYRREMARHLSYGDQKRLEIARALMMEPKLLLMDEPNSGMNDQETLALIHLIQKIRTLNITILLISHHMKFVHEISDRVIVLNFGKMIAAGKPEEVARHDQVIAAYLGKVG